MSMTARFRGLGNIGGRAVNGTNTADSNNNGAASAAKRRPLSSAAFSLRPHGNKPHGRRGKTLMGRNTVLSKLLWPGQKEQNASSNLDQGPRLKDQSGPRKQYSIEDLLKMREEHRELPKDLPHFAGITGLGLGLRDDAPDTWDMPTDIIPKETEITRPKAEIPILTRHQDNKSKKHNKQKGKQKEKQQSSSNGKDKSKPSTPQNVSTSKQQPQPVTTKQQKPQQQQIANASSPSSEQSDQSQTGSQENKPKKAAWKRASDLDPLERLEKKIKGILNKLTVDKFEGLSEQFCDFCVEHVKNTEELRKVVSLIFDKAVDEPEFVKMYADLCVNVNDRAPNFEDSRPSTFLRSLISQCQTRFQENVSYSSIRKDPGMTDEDYEYLIIKVKKHTIGNVNFIGELFNVGLLKEPVMQTCIRHLIGGGNPASEDCERLCTLLTTIGKGLDQTTNEHYKQAVEDTFTLLKRLAFKRGQDSRVKFLLLDVIDLRANNWVPRKEKLQPKKIEEIHREAKEAELMQDYLSGGSRPTPSHENQVNRYGITNDGTQSMSRRELATTVADAIGGGAFSHDASSNPVSSIKRTHVRYEKRARLQKQSDKIDIQNSDAFQTPQTPESADSERFTSFGLLPSRKTKVPRKQVPDSTQDDIPSQNTPQPSENVATSVASEEPEEQYTDDESNEMKEKLVTNFLDSQDIKKAKQEFKRLRFSKVEYVYELLRTACDRHEEEREVATKILNELLDEDQITKNHITKVFDDWMGQLYDALIDAPLLLDYLSGIFARLLIHGGSISMNYVAACVKKDEFFVEELYDQKLIVKILDSIKIEANLEKVKAMLADCDTALDVMVSDDKLRNSFLEKHKLEGV